MFLEALLARNPRLVGTAFTLHRQGAIPPNCFVIDLDAVAHNAALLGQAARKYGLSLYFTTKQVGFNPLVASCVSRSGIEKALAIDFREASVLARNHVPVGHIGHLVQLPVHAIDPLLALDPEVITVFSLEKARQISAAAVRLGKQARLLLRVVSAGDFIYPGQEGGIAFEQLEPVAAAILGLPNVRIHGVTAYPCLELQNGSRSLRATHNFETILQAVQLLENRSGVRVEQINAPGNTCVSSMPILAEMGATHGEPGHALTGTTYLHTHLDEPEMPALVYVSEVSHLHGECAYIFGGGTHRRAKIHQALVGSSVENAVKVPVLPVDPSVIDYYLALSLPDPNPIQVGDCALLASRAQVFVTRACVAVVQGLQSGSPRFLGLFDSAGCPVEMIV